MPSFTANVQQLRTKAEELSGLNSNFKTTVSELEAEEQTLAGMWDGQAKEAFHQAFNSDKIQMTNFSTLIDKYVAVLLNIAAKYEQVDNAGAEIASTRTYQ